MKTAHHHDLQPLNSFAISSISPAIYFPKTIDELTQVVNQLNSPFYILGEGSNTLFAEHNAPVIIKPEILGRKVLEQGDDVLVTVNCGENWHQLVQFCVESGFHGIENLALIPGSVGAAPVQNIGAYGTELSDVVESVEWFDFEAQKLDTFTNEQCQFEYRNSIFKQGLRGKGLITQVMLKLSKKWQANTSYHGLDSLPEDASVLDVFNKVIEIRSSKLPNPKELPNAGSFFKNPMVDKKKWQTLKDIYPNMPAYPVDENTMKLAAGWLIDQAGLKGFKQNGVGVHQHQALVLVNYQQASGQSLIELASLVQQKVKALFGVNLEPEVRIVDAKGLCNQTLRDK